MRNQKKSPAPEAAQCPNRTSAPGRRDQQHRVLKVLQPGAIRQARRDGGHRRPTHRPSAPAPRSAKLGRKPPLIPLTLRAMLGSRHRPARGSGRSVFSLLSVLALLALAVFPVAASADSAGYEYENAIPSPTGGAHKAPTVVGGGEEDGKAHTSNTGGGATGGTGPGSGGGSSEGGNAGTPGPQGGGEAKGGNGSANPQHQNGAKDAGNVSSLQQVPDNGSSSDDGGGSSPVVPILIVVALLAAISVGIVYWQRRRGDDAPITPKAG
jgi:hypothetical protein